MTKPKFNGEVSQEQIDAWKKMHGEIFAIKCEDQIFYFKKPDRKLLGFSSVAGKTNPMKFNEALFNGCYLGGSDAHKTDDNMFYGIVNQLAETVAAKEAELVKL
jgi:hypothetical protein